MQSVFPHLFAPLANNGFCEAASFVASINPECRRIEGMRNTSLRTVTRPGIVPILIPVTELKSQYRDEAEKLSDGWIGLPSQMSEGFRDVQVIEVSSKTAETLLPPLKGESKERYDALAHLRTAISAQDSVRLKAAIRGALVLQPVPRGIPIVRKYDFTGKSLEWLLHSARAHRSFLTNLALRDTQPVVWIARRGAGIGRPGLFCENSESVRFALRLFEPGIVRVCPGCNVLFHPATPRRIYHDDTCRVRHKRMRDAKSALAIIRQNPNKTVSTLFKLLETAKVRQSRTWIGEQLASLDSK
jgi:hypothetical protein